VQLILRTDLGSDDPTEAKPRSAELDVEYEKTNSFTKELQQAKAELGERRRDVAAPECKLLKFERRAHCGRAQTAARPREEIASREVGSFMIVRVCIHPTDALVQSCSSVEKTWMPTRAHN
jgi:hypothetical protein